MLIIYALALVRIILVLMPMNNWGTAEGNYMFGIYRNIPFAIMGALLIYWSYQERVKEGLANMWILILLSFLFYIPVVLWSDTYPIVGALMMPKTVAYLLIVVFGYKYYICAFERINLLGLAFTNLIMGLLAGVFYREFSKFYLYYEPTHLGKIHGHVLTLGFIGMLLLYLLTGNMTGEETILSTTQIFNLKTGDYSDKLLEAYGLDRDKLPKITKAGSITGNVKNGLIEELKGLDVEVVSVCGHDTASAVLLTKVMTDADTMFLSCGTWSLFGIRVESPDLSAKAYEKGLTNELGFDSTPLLFKNLTGLYLLEKYKIAYEKKLGRKLEFDEITAYVEESLKKQETISNLIDMEDPRFGSEEADAKEVIDEFLKEKGLVLPENEMDYFRVIYESMVKKYLEVKTALEEISGKKYEKVHMIGGGAKSSLLCKLIAKRLNVSIIAGPYEASALGNIIVQLKAIGEIKSIEEGLDAAYKSQEMKTY